MKSPVLVKNMHMNYTFGVLTMRMAPIEIDSRLPILEDSQLYDIAIVTLDHVFCRKLHCRSSFGVAIPTR